MPIKIDNGQGIKALKVYTDERMLDREKVLVLFEFLAFINLGLPGMLAMVKNPHILEIDLPDEPASAILSLAGDHGPVIVKAMIITRCGPSKRVLLKGRKWFYLLAAFVMSMYYEVRERIFGRTG